MTKSQAKVYDALARFTHAHGYSPSLEELSRLVGLRSLATVHVHLQKLIAQGKVRKGKDFARSWEITPVREDRCPTCGQLVEKVS